MISRGAGKESDSTGEASSQGDRSPKREPFPYTWREIHPFPAFALPWTIKASRCYSQSAALSVPGSTAHGNLALALADKSRCADVHFSSKMTRVRDQMQEQHVDRSAAGKVQVVPHRVALTAEQTIETTVLDTLCSNGPSSRSRRVGRTCSVRPFYPELHAQPRAAHRTRCLSMILISVNS
jgi:hypothetical protein